MEKPDSFSLSTEILRRGDRLRFTARGGSMYPSIRDGDVLTVKPVHPSQLRIGEVAFYRMASGGIAHRLVGASRMETPNLFLLQGDRSIRPDPPVRADQILGKVTGVARNGRAVQLETPGKRIVGLVWALTSPLRPILYPALRPAFRAFRRWAQLSSAEKLLLLFAKTELEDVELGHMARWLRFINWEELIERSVLHGLAPRASLHLQKLKGDVPEAVLARFRQIYLLNLKHNLRLRSELSRVIGLFNSNRVRAIPLKGVFLAEWLHGDIGLRPSSDLDLLVRREDLPVVRRELRRAGYESSGPYPPRFAEEFLRHEAFVRADSPSNPLCLEIHWSFFPSLLADFDISRVWKNSAPVEVGKSRFLALSPEDALLYLAITLKLHGYIGLKLLLDLHALLEAHPRVDWGRVLEAAKENQQRAGLYYALEFARDLLGAQVPEWVIAELAPNALQRATVSLVLNRRTVLRPVGNRLRRVYWDLVRLVTMDRPLDIPRTVARAVFLHPREVRARHQQLWQEPCPRKPFRTPR